MIKLVYCLHRLPGMSFEEFSRYWIGPHADLMKEHGSKLGILKYIQSHAVGPEAAQAMQTIRGLQDPFDGIAEIYFESLEALDAGNPSAETLAAQALLLADEKRFIDLSRSVIFFAEEKPIIESVTK
jgi:hypothetical protein